MTNNATLNVSTYIVAVVYCLLSAQHLLHKINTNLFISVTVDLC